MEGDNHGYASKSAYDVTPDVESHHNLEPWDHARILRFLCLCGADRHADATVPAVAEQDRRVACRRRDLRHRVSRATARYDYLRPYVRPDRTQADVRRHAGDDGRCDGRYRLPTDLCRG